jgi:hypothetical protein
VFIDRLESKKGFFTFDALFWTRVESCCSTGVFGITLEGNEISGKVFVLCGHIPVARHFWSPWGITIHQRP